MGVECGQSAIRDRPVRGCPSAAVIIPFSMKFEGERPTVRSLIGSVVAVAGVILMTNLVEK